MKSGSKAALSLSLFLATATVCAGDFDGSRPLTCAPTQVNDCLPGAACTQKTPESAGFGDTIMLDFSKKQATGKYRPDPLPIRSLDRTDEQLILQGTDLKFAWSAVIFQADGRMATTIVDRQGAFVFFGQCQPQ